MSKDKATTFPSNSHWQQPALHLNCFRLFRTAAAKICAVCCLCPPKKMHLCTSHTTSPVHSQGFKIILCYWAGYHKLLNSITMRFCFFPSPQEELCFRKILSLLILNSALITDTYKRSICHHSSRAAILLSLYQPMMLAGYF